MKRRKRKSNHRGIMPFARRYVTGCYALTRRNGFSVKWSVVSAFGGDWSQVTGTQLYTVHDIYPFIVRTRQAGIFQQD